MVGKQASVSQKLMKAWPWEWRPPGFRDQDWESGGYTVLDDEKSLPTMIPNRRNKVRHPTLLIVFVGLLTTAVVLQLAIIFGINGLGCPC